MSAVLFVLQHAAACTCHFCANSKGLMLPIRLQVTKLLMLTWPLLPQDYCNGFEPV